ncbi:AMP-binding protein [Microbacterium sp. No. 7]|uniref:AMP-binding protein n=1 Tax=Microbacterium sp. No. 7 TaxID=1714373 RepID=UPI0006D19D0A|nr:AMP-binding protein [Microbacterium sp. No. 7]ALJ21870.1 cyclohexanecarboxylate--CoA ligase [Microbacterium sp. No. 7]
MNEDVTTSDWARKIPREQREDFLARGWWRDRTPVDDLLEAIERNPHKAAVVSYAKGSAMPRTVTYGQLGSLITRFAGALDALGVGKGDIVSIQLPNTWEFPALAIAAMRIGAIPNPIPHIYRENELSFMLRHAGSKVYIVKAQHGGFSYADMARRLRPGLPELAHVVVLGEDDGDFTSFDDFFVDTRWDLVDGVGELLAQRHPQPDDPALLLFTSGTTGRPKAAVHSHNTLWAQGRPIADAVQMVEDDVSFMASTVGHLTGFYWGTYLPLSLGQKVVYQDAWDPRALVDMIEYEGITWMLSATPFALDMIDALKQQPRPLGSLRAFACGGAPIPPHVAIQMQEHLGVELLSLWGMSEVGVCTIHQLGTPVEVLAESDGMQVEYVDLRIVDDNDEPVADGEEGRLQMRGPGIILGYYKQPEAIAAAMDDEGWFDTGDNGRRTPHGGIRITGRSKDIIVRGGQNVPVVEIENLLLTHPGVKEVAVVAYPDDRMGERGCACVVAAGDATPTLADLTAHLAEAGFTKQFWPERLLLLDQFPKTPAGKVQKYRLRELVQEDIALAG